ncbi:putative thyroid adenoma-associated protein-like isoform X1 [Apostichopus japonicus]|uniref:Putative thyroid adenoma-associated protein-like isoform X1 n=1 Tax=Stichopus japonicus TaxID=307972 RepID=A0A2G8JLM1_STIJA|nr:putative thyroid adenoma-associated protein-like isoform X1 [Apostichopus japonicus]
MPKTRESSIDSSLTVEVINRIKSLSDLSASEKSLSRSIKPFDLKTAKLEADALLKCFQKISTDVNGNTKTLLDEIEVRKVLDLCFTFAPVPGILNKLSKIWKLVEVIHHQIDISIPVAIDRFAEYFGFHELRSGNDHAGSKHDGVKYDDVNLVSVANLLEVRCVVPQVLESHAEFFLNDLLAFRLKCASEGIVRDDGFATVKLLLQICQLQPEAVHLWWTKRNQENGLEFGLDDILMGLIRMMSEKSYPPETSHISSLALVNLLKTVSLNDTLSKNIEIILQYLLKGSSSTSDDNSLLIGGQAVAITSLTDLSQSERTFGLSCLGKATLSGLPGSMLITSTKDTVCLLEMLLEMICILDKRKLGAEYQYVQFISAWYETCLLLANNPEWELAESLWSKMELVMQIMWCVVSTPIAGLQEQLMKAFQSFIKLLYLETKKENQAAAQLYRQLTQKVLAAPFHIKTRYIILGSIIQSFGSSAVISAHPVIPEELVRCMHTNHLRAVSEQVYKNCMEDLRNKVNEEQAGDNAVLEEWKRLWGRVILDGLCNHDSLARSHICDYFMPHTLKALPGCVELLLASLNSLEGISEARKLHAKIMILKQAKMKGVLTETSMMQYESLLTSGLLHLEDCIRSDSFGLLVHSSLTSHPFTARSSQLVKEFIVDNLNSDNTAFRNNFVNDVKIALYRMRDSASPLIKELSPNSRVEGQYFQEDDVTGKLVAMATTVDEIFENCLRGLFPGASYQRKRTCLDVLIHLYQCFLKTAEDRKRKRGISEESKIKLLRWMQENGKCHLLSARSASMLLSGLLSSSNDLRNSAFGLLVTHFPWPLPHCDTYPWAEPTEILCLGLKLVSSPRVHECEAGSLLCKLSFMKNVIEKKTHMRNIYPKKTFDEPVRKAKKQGNKQSRPIFPPKHESPSFHFLRSLLDSLKYQFTAMQQNALMAAAVTPMHGLVMALSQCVTEVPGCLEVLAGEDEADAKTFLSELVNTLQGICKFILELLSGRALNTEAKSDTTPNFSPSFGEMTMAITDVVSSLSQLQVEDGVDEETNSSVGHQLIFSCSWLSLKHCCHLMSNISAQLIQNNRLHSMMEDVEHVAIATALFDILTLCRQKGVIENCSVALSCLCSAFLTSSKPALEEEVEQLLQRTFDLISNEDKQSSFSKKSAGLPMLVEAVVTAEPNQRERKLLKLSMLRLMAIAKKPLPDDLGDKEDLPQAHALNIMRSLFRSAIIVEDVSIYVSNVLQCTISGFSSPSFVVRNSSMQLFGILVSKLFGQKKVTEEHSLMNALSVEELFSRHGDMWQYLLTEVTSAAENLGEQGQDSCLTIRPGLQPVLVILSKLGRGIQENISKPFRESLLILLSSPIYFVRRLAPRALLPFIAQSELDDFIENLLIGFPSTQERVSHNKIHGELLLLQELINQETGNDQRIYKIGQRLSQMSSWIGEEANPCAFTRAAFIRVLSLTLENVINISATDELVKSCQNIVENAGNMFSKFEIGGPELCNTIVDLAFAMIRKGWVPSPGELAVNFLRHASQDIRLATLTSINSHLKQFSSVEDVEVLAKAIIHCLLEETSHSNHSEALNVWAGLCAVVAGESTLKWDISQWQELHSKLITMATGGDGSLLCASSIPALSALCRVDSQRCQDGFNWHEWVSLMTQYCQPDQSETLRMAVVKSLHMAAGKCFAALCEKEEERDAQCAVGLLQCIFKLLQDEQAEIRKNTAIFVNVFTHNASESSVECVQVIRALKRMALHFCNLFSWSRTVLTMLFEWLSGSPSEAVTAMDEQLKVSQINLFEQISNNIFEEPVIEAEYLAAGIEVLVLKVSDKDPDFITKCGDRYQTAVVEIEL